ncbi:hypothetical protein N9I91_04555, partial [Candidatus Pseudothioglobus singularis]|nr:hypothetical protein [Candidatus Pseudothioglobus singularis]
MNNNNETSKIREIFNKLFGLKSSTKNLPDKADAIAKAIKDKEAKARREKEAKARREAETSNLNKENQLQSNLDVGDIHKILQKMNDLSDEFKILRSENEKKDEEIQ